MNPGSSHPAKGLQEPLQDRGMQDPPVAEKARLRPLLM
jgi:hypothetical protein